MKHRKNYKLNKKSNKRDLRASGLSLLPLALRPLLLSIQKFIRSNSIQNSNSNLDSNSYSNSNPNSNLNPNSKTTRFCLSSAISFLFVLFGIFIIQNSYTNSVSAKSITLTIPSEALNLSVSPGSGSVFKKSSPGTISVSTDSSRGYSLSIQSKTSSDLLNGPNKIISIKSPLSESDYENSGDVNTWGYLPSKLGGSINTDFQPGPTTESTTLDRVETSSEGTDYGLTLATKIDGSLPAGNYSNTFVLSATANDSPYDNIMQDWQGCESLGSEETIELQDIRDNKTYTVAKLKDGKCWMTKNLEIGKEDAEMTLTSDTSDTGGDFTISASMENPNANRSYNSNEIHIDSTYGGYYTWYTATAGEGTQNISGTNVEHSICPKGWRLPTKYDFGNLDVALGGTGGDQGGVESQIAKYEGEPNNFLMGGAYNSGINSSVGDAAFYWSSTASNRSIHAYLFFFSYNTVYTQHINDKAMLRSVRCISRSPNPTIQNVEQWGDSVSEGQTVTATDVRDNKQYTVSRLSDGKLWMTKNLEIGKTDSEMTLTSDTSDTASDFTLLASSDKPNSSNAYDSREIHLDPTYGGYYTWYAVTAGEGTQDITTDGQNMEHSICPKGWRLPTKDEFITLDKALGGTGSSQSNAETQVAKYTGTPNNFLMGGLYGSGNPSNVGSDAHYWSSTAYDANRAYYLIFASSYVYPQNSNDKSFLRPVRCISRSTNPTMQNVKQWDYTIEIGETKTVPDIRDGKQYTVARLADDKLWMTQNLEIENYNLTSADSDVASNFQIPASTDKPNSSNSYNSKELHIDSTYGGYYTWYTATAGEGTPEVSTDGANVQHSICPKGWRLPTNYDFINLDRALGGTGKSRDDSKSFYQKYTGAPNNFLMGGYYANGNSYEASYGAGYWSSTAYNNSIAYYLNFYSYRISPQNNASRDKLYSVRCISRQ